MLVIAVAVLIAILLLFYNRLANSYVIRYQSFLAADELRQSSDDLTRLVRTYVQTGDRRFEQMYWEVLAIRNGEQVRPDHYEMIYWDFVTSSFERPKRTGEKLALKERMRLLGISPEELAKLKEAETESNSLVFIERTAMNAMKGIFLGESGEFNKIGEPDLELARNILFDNTYHRAKSRIMYPINDFYLMVDQRTLASVTANTNYLIGTVTLLAAVLLVLFYLFVLDRRKLNDEISERYRAEDEVRLLNQSLNQAKLAAEAGNRSKSEFLTVINHELRTPMNGIFAGIQRAQQHPHEPLGSSLDLIQRGASSMMSLINDILIFTEVQSDQLLLSTETYDLSSGLDILHERYQRACKDKGLALNWQPDEKLPDLLELDGDKLLTVLSKLMDNAVKFTDSGTIGFNLSCDQDQQPWQLFCTIQDSGLGIEESDKERIFSAFQQKSAGFQRRFGGLGIGLAICKELVNTMKGILTLESKLGTGTIVTLSLPVAAGVAPELVTGDLVLASSELPILIVEDDEFNQQIMEKALKNIGYQSVVANHGEEALALLDTRAVSLILMDIQMPVMDGFTCTEAIRKRDDPISEIPIIAVTANLMDADKERCLKAGMNAYLSKPVNLQILRKTLAQYIAPSSQ